MTRFQIPEYQLQRVDGGRRSLHRRVKDGGNDVRALKQSMKNSLRHLPPSMKTWIKTRSELSYWKKRAKSEGDSFDNSHYQQFFTELFNLTLSDFDGKSIIDIGCGPRGSLEWAVGATRRVGLDPLAIEYTLLNRGVHAMEYVAGSAESIPFAEGSFDYVSALNSLDHVESVERAIDEMERVTAPSGSILLIVEVNHEPTVNEPHTLSTDIVERFTRCDVVDSALYGLAETHDIYRSINEGRSAADHEPGVLCAHLRKRAA
ncbi:MAG: methyltransferase domain-containing protein [Pseudomonadota bacterium]